MTTVPRETPDTERDTDMNVTTYILVRRTPQGTVLAHRMPFPSVRDAARVAGLVLSDNAGLKQAEAQTFSAQLAAEPIGTIGEHACGYAFRILAADFTDDGVLITPGLRVMTNDLEWGSVGRDQFMRTSPMAPGGQHFEGWYSVELNDTGREKDFNGERLTTDGSRFSKPDPQLSGQRVSE